MGPRRRLRATARALFAFGPARAESIGQTIDVGGSGDVTKVTGSLASSKAGSGSIRIGRAGPG